MRYQYIDTDTFGTTQRNVIIEVAVDQYTSFPAVEGNPAFDGLLAQTGLTLADVQAAPAGEWNDMPEVTP